MLALVFAVPAQQHVNLYAGKGYLLAEVRPQRDPEYVVLLLCQAVLTLTAEAEESVRHGDLCFRQSSTRSDTAAQLDIRCASTKTSSPRVDCLLRAEFDML